MLSYPVCKTCSNLIETMVVSRGLVYDFVECKECVKKRKTEQQSKFRYLYVCEGCEVVKSFERDYGNVYAVYCKVCNVCQFHERVKTSEGKNDNSGEGENQEERKID